MTGPGNPPVNSRFKKGKSGNPRGRPRAKKEPVSVYQIVLDKKLTVVQNGVSRELTLEEALQLKLYNQAIAGSRRAQRQIIKMIEEREKAAEARREPVRHPIEMRMEPDPNNADAALQILDIAKRDPRPIGEDTERDHLLLEPWAVNAALVRRRGDFTKDELDAVMRCTRDARGSLRFPRRYQR